MTQGGNDEGAGASRPGRLCEASMTKTEESLKNLMREIHRRNVRYKRAVLAGGPEVGIFWVFKGKPLIAGDPLSEAPRRGDIKGTSDTHLHMWKAYQQAGVVPEDVGYDEVPRGRVEYNVKTRQFHIIADPCILTDPSALSNISERLRLPSSQTQTGTDEHYRCPGCSRGTRRRK